ncbi:MAG: cytochrome d ubiquinol oxidase subunit II [Planctomycetes bacterium]|nr:cytochrome d ubiquinol oxidase subunit II [Planctomycetota bacterium]
MSLDLATTWFVLLGVLLTGYAILDGFDLGVGILHPLCRGDRERRVAMNAIGPLWDGNEVWLVTFGGALFAAFPEAYATVFSAFYLPFMLLLFCLILRAVSLEFRSKRPGPRWRATWDRLFFLSCTGATFLFGVAVGDSMIGLDIDAHADYRGGLLGLLRPYALLVGALAVSLFALHGSLFLGLKTEGELRDRLHRWSWRFFLAFFAFFATTTAITVHLVPAALTNFETQPWLVAIPLLLLAAVGNIARCLHRGSPGQAFASSCATIAGLVTLFGIALFPHLVMAHDAEHSLTIHNASSSPTTLKIMLTIALIGMPFVVAYTVAIYWIYRGKVKLDDFSY